MPRARKPAATVEPRDRMTEAGLYWYGIKVASGALTLRHATTATWRKVNPSRARMGFPVEEIMRRRGLSPFIPVESIFIRNDRFHLGAKRRVKRAILPGLVFLELPAAVNWLAISEIPMVTGLFTLYGQPYRFHPEGIARLRAISAGLYQPETYRPMPTRRAYKPGDEVVDLTGVFEGKFRVSEVTGEIAKFLVPFFGDLREITTSASHLAKAAE